MKKIMYLVIAIVAINFKVEAQIKIDNGGIVVNGGDISEFNVQGNSWNNRFITYFIQNTTPDILPVNSRTSIQNAFRSWQAITRLYFIEVCNANAADIVILWGQGNHGDNFPFDGGGTAQGNVLAHAFFPPPNAGALAGDMHFDDFEDWTDLARNNGFPPIDLETVALHEIGHSLGLNHTNIGGSVMEAFYNGSRRNLGNDDIAGMRSIYGSNIEFITGPNSIGNTGVFGIAEALPAGINLIWTVDNPCITITTNGNNVTVNNPSFTGNFTLTATLTNGCGTLVFNRVISASVPPPNLTINGATTFCTGASAYSLNGLPPCVTNVVWSLIPLDNHPNIVSLSCSNCTSTTLTKLNNGTVLLRAAVTYPNSSTTYTYQQYIGVGTPVFRGWYNSPNNPTEPLNPWTRQNMNATNEVCYGTYITTSTDATANSSVTWTDAGNSGGVTWTQIGNNLRFYFNNIDQWAFFNVSITNSCGSRSIRYRFNSTGATGCGGPMLRVAVSPNPSTNSINISLADNDRLQNKKGMMQIKIMDKTGIIKQVKNYNKQTEATIDIANLPLDVYTIMVFDGKEWHSTKFIKN